MKLNAEQVVQFEERGYLLLRGALTDADLDPIIAEYEAHIGRRAEQMLAEGKISELYAHEPFNRRLVSICRENNEIYKELDIMHFRGRALFEFLRNDNLLDLVESLVGPEITCNPIQHLRPKLPAGLTPAGGDAHVARWHQDMAVMRAEADPHLIVTAWRPLAASTPENGCLQIIPGSHKSILPKQGDQLSAEERAIHAPDEKRLYLEMESGEVALLHNWTLHRSEPNKTDRPRRAFSVCYIDSATVHRKSGERWPQVFPEYIPIKTPADS